MRDHETIDSELRRIASERRSMHQRGSDPDWARVDKLLDERLGHVAEASEADIDADTLRELVGPVPVSARRRPRSIFRHLGLRAALPLSLLAVALAVGAVIVAMRAGHHPIPPPPPAEVPSSSASSTSVAPKALAPLSDIVDTAFVGALKHEGVPIPSREYALTQGHAVCDSLGHQSTFTEAVHAVQRSTIWDADQSAAVAAGAIVSYCPQYQASSSTDMQQTYQSALSDLQRIQGDLQGIRDRLQDIPGR
jgi:Protein of unknown function (DUF732)